MKNVLAIIGGSGLYDIKDFTLIEKIDINTPWGHPSDQIMKINYEDKEFYFLPRHNKYHQISPSNINYRANVFALKKLGVTDILSISAVGSLKETLPPKSFVIVDQYIDLTHQRKKSFFDKTIVAHVSMAKPTSQGLMDACENALKKSDAEYKKGGTYVVIEGPQFSSLAESNLYRLWNADVIGMTNMPESKLAREAQIRYASIAMVTDYDCWHEDHENVSVTEVIHNINSNLSNAKNVIKEILNCFEDYSDPSDPALSSLTNAIMTNYEYFDEEDRKILSVLSKNSHD